MRAWHAIAVAVLAESCGPHGDHCGDGVAQPGEVCLQPRLPLEDELAQELMDFDGDGISDLVGLREAHVRFLHNRGDATFEPVGDVAYDALGGTPIVLHDIDGDGVDELGVIEVDDGRPQAVRVFAWDAAGTLRLERTLLARLPSRLYGHVVGDFDGNGERDVAFYGDDRVTVLQQVDGEIVAAGELSSFRINSHGSAEVLVGDLDGDGADEACHPWRNSLRVRKGPGLASSEALALPLDNRQVALSDIDGDGSAEVVAWSRDARRVFGSVLKRTGSGGLLAVVSTFEAQAVMLLLADLNGDAMDDLVLLGDIGEASRSDAGSRGDAGHVRLATGDGGFGPELRISSLHAADWRPAHLDDDGALDLAKFHWSDVCGLPRCSFYGEPLLSAP